MAGPEQDGGPTAPSFGHQQYVPLYATSLRVFNHWKWLESEVIFTEGTSSDSSVSWGRLVWILLSWDSEINGISQHERYKTAFILF